ncbi:hypothetical protein CL620_04235, partial [archaeon]|nr:hypothetical protein [archaeon]
NCDAKDLKFETNFFDKVLATYVLRVAPNPFKIMSEVSRVSKNGASFVIVDKFKEGNYFLHNTIQKISLFLGWGKDYNHKKLCKGTAWQSVHKEKLHSISASRIVILQNKKKVSHSKKSY